VRRDDAHEGAAFLMRLTDEADVAQPEVTKPTVDQLRGRARRRSSEVTAVDERDRKTRA
jgi:hypothetical protein